MKLTEDDLRRLIRDAVARHLGRPAPPVEGPPAGHPPAPHPSQAVYLTIVNPGDACVIEPGVDCNHCGYCRTHGY